MPFKPKKFKKFKPFTPKEKKEAPPPKPITPDEAIAKLEYFCAYQERHTKEVLDKIASFDIQDEDLIADLMKSLRGDDFLNDERYALFYASGKLRMNYWGKIKIRIELRRKKLDNAFIDAAIEALSEEEYEEVFEKLKQRKLRELRGKDAYTQRQKISAFLSQKGFEWEMIARSFEKK